ncbi:hypothetical protein [Vibrio phage JSF12]|uniref:Uncharacterized protein n=2 Tax=Jesfedecavirus TaxID=2560156 RepID=A0A2D0Z3T9_9CAUD|nr:hypothetical protein FDI98_gp101 [Vibrio phage JSF10]YP_009794833.1 hypothetical protein HOS35_gp150 [Vibrio phage JSF12]ASV43431.1 hypothetical protein [Vibrio phage JSF10]ASV43668.1 hypothetical protein [Vibrio phage JSF12]
MRIPRKKLKKLLDLGYVYVAQDGDGEVAAYKNEPTFDVVGGGDSASDLYFWCPNPAGSEQYEVLPKQSEYLEIKDYLTEKQVKASLQKISDLLKDKN